MKRILKKYKHCTVAALFSICLFTSCRKLVEAPPPTDVVTGANAYSTDATAITVLNGIYINMSQGGTFQGGNGISLLSGLSADELGLYAGGNSGPLGYYYRNDLQPIGTTPNGSEHWPTLYNYVFKCNEAIEGLSESGTLSPAIKQQLLGEAKFMRAFCYFYLANFFGDLPLVLGTDPKVNTMLPRTSKNKVYEQVVADLQDAEGKLSNDYLRENLLNITTERVRPTKWAAKALLARVYLYTNNSASAESKATEVINNVSLFGPLPALNTFLKNSREAIWQIQPTEVNFNTREARTLVITGNGPNGSNPVFLSANLLGSFESNDQRAVNGNWVNAITVSGNTYGFPFKYKLNLSDASITNATGTTNMKEYFIVLRLGEQYLIRAEARAQQNNLTGAIADLDVIRNRAGLPLISNINSGISRTALLDKIYHERQVELFCELGHRWIDLKRTGKIDEVMNVVTPLKSNGTIAWRPYQALYPLPFRELQWGPNLIQNTGY